MKHVVIDHREQVTAGSPDALDIGDLPAAAVRDGVLMQHLVITDDG